LDTRMFLADAGHKATNALEDSKRTIGWCKEDSVGADSNPLIIWGCDNMGTGAEAMLVMLCNLRGQQPTPKPITIDLSAFWYGKRASGDITIRIRTYASDWASGSGLKPANLRYYNPRLVEDILFIGNIFDESQSCGAGEFLGFFQYQPTTGQTTFASNRCELKSHVVAICGLNDPEGVSATVTATYNNIGYGAGCGPGWHLYGSLTAHVAGDFLLPSYDNSEATGLSNVGDMVCNLHHNNCRLSLGVSAFVSTESACALAVRLSAAVVPAAVGGKLLCGVEGPECAGMLSLDKVLNLDNNADLFAGHHLYEVVDDYGGTWSFDIVLTPIGGDGHDRSTDLSVANQFTAEHGWQFLAGCVGRTGVTVDILDPSHTACRFPSEGPTGMGFLVRVSLVLGIKSPAVDISVTFAGQTIVIPKVRSGYTGSLAFSASVSATDTLTATVTVVVLDQTFTGTDSWTLPACYCPECDCPPSNEGRDSRCEACPECPHFYCTPGVYVLTSTRTCTVTGPYGCNGAYDCAGLGETLDMSEFTASGWAGSCNRTRGWTLKDATYPVWGSDEGYPILAGSVSSGGTLEGLPSSWTDGSGLCYACTPTLRLTVY